MGASGARRRESLGREVERAQRGAVSVSVYVGEVGSKLEIELTVERVVEVQTDYGALRIITMRDVTGNALVWKTSAAQVTPGDRVTCRGAVKAHSEYRGEKQTQLTRCKLAKILATPPVPDAGPAPAVG